MATKPSVRRGGRRSQGLHWTSVLAAAPAVVAMVVGVLLLVLMLGNAARLTPATLERRAAQNLGRGANADASIDYRRLLQQTPADAKYRDGLRSALNRTDGQVSP